MFAVVKDYQVPAEPALEIFKKDGSNKGDFYGVETLSSQKFAQNYGGYPRSDIALINEQQNLSVAESMLENLPDFSTQNNPNQGLSDIEIIKGIQSKYMQSPAEVIPYLEKKIQERNDRLAAIEAEKAAAAQAEKTNVDDVIDNV